MQNNDDIDDINKKKITKNIEMMATQMTPTTPPGNTREKHIISQQIFQYLSKT